MTMIELVRLVLLLSAFTAVVLADNANYLAIKLKTDSAMRYLVPAVMVWFLSMFLSRSTVFTIIIRTGDG